MHKEKKELLRKHDRIISYTKRSLIIYVIMLAFFRRGATLIEIKLIGFD